MMSAPPEVSISKPTSLSHPQPALERTALTSEANRALLECSGRHSALRAGAGSLPLLVLAELKPVKEP